MKSVTCSLTLASLAAIAVPVFAAEGEAEKVQFDGFMIEPMGHITSPDGALAVHPKAMLGVGYNNNVYATEHFRRDSTFVQGIAGVDVGWAMSRLDRLTLTVEYVGQGYFNVPGRNLQGARGAARWHHEAEQWDANAGASYARTNDPFVNTGEQIKHDDYALSLDGTRRWLYESFGLGLTFDRRDYLEDSLTFRKNDRDVNDYGVTARAGHELGDDAEIYVRAVLDRRDYSKNTNITGRRGYNDSNGALLLIGDKTKLGTRSALVAELGAIYRVYRYDFARNPAYNDQTVIAPAANLAFIWRFQEGSAVTARAYSTVEDSVSANAAWIYGARVDGRYQLRSIEKIALLAGVGAYQLHDSGHSAAQGSDEVRTTEEFTLGVEYLLRKGIATRAKYVGTNSTSKFFEDFSRSIISLEIAVVY